MPTNISLIFVYNADSGFVNALLDSAHKLISPQTYQCKLCAISYSYFGMRKKWKQFITKIGIPVKFYHRDEFIKHYPKQNVKLPAIFYVNNHRLTIYMSANDINNCQSIDELMEAIKKRKQIMD